MLFIILLVSFGAVITAFFLIYVPIRHKMTSATEHAQRVVARDLDEMFLFISVRHMGYWKLGFMAGLGLAVFLLAGNMDPPAPFLFAGVAAVAGFFGPELLVGHLARQRRRKFGEQLVDALVLLSNGLRAGFTLQQAIEMLVEETKPPISQEFALVMREYRLGVDMDKALANCVRRTRDEDLGLAITAIAITRQVGGNLAEIFDRIVTMIRDRKILEGKVAALTAQGRLQALVVALIPYILAAVIARVNPELMRLMWTTMPGFIAIGLVVILDLLGYMWVVKLCKVEY